MNMTMKMPEPAVANRSWGRAVAIGLAVSVLTAVMMVSLSRSGLSPLPKPLGLAFAETLLRRDLPLPVGLLFHTAYVTFWSVLFVRFSPRRSLPVALALAAGLWLVVLLLFFPLVGWGIAGLAVSPKLIIAALMPQLLFGVLLWALNRFANRPNASANADM